MSRRLTYTRHARSTLWLVRGDLFPMGDPQQPDAQPNAEIEVDSFYLSKTSITNAEFEAFWPGHERAPASSEDEAPVANVSFGDASRYCDWYSEVSGKTFRLPSEIEWEFACRAGSRTRYHWGEDPADAEQHAWDAENSGERAHPGELKRANAWGLHDMLGNVWEWTSSRYLPTRGASGDVREVGDRVIRGGSFRVPRALLGCGVRRAAPEGFRADDLGFRIARSL